ncbi:MAG: CHAD domain-containing protein [Chlorobiaceae bacterium]|nr:CHAD domain-containing protein [Chlorobiaceae bacterium]
MNPVADTIYFRVIEPDSPELPSRDNLPDNWKIEKIATRKERHTYYDTFESHAYHKGLLVVRKRGRLEVVSLETGNVSGETRFPKTPSSFLPACLDNDRVKELLLGCTGVRAFMRICSIDVGISSWKVLDENLKTVAIMNSESLRLADAETAEPFARFFSLSPLRGYHKELARLLRALPEPVDTYRITGFRERYLQITKAAGHPIGGYSSKLRLQLDPETTIHENVRRLLQFTISVMIANETGIRNDIDTEFLHDFRVATRRARSILRQVRSVFDPHRTAWALALLREFGKRTNTLRDHDVCLLRKDEYLAILPSELRPGLEIFYRELSDERRQLHRQLCAYLAGAEYRNAMQEFGAFISCGELPDQELAPCSALPTKTAACKTIGKAWKKVIVHGRRIASRSDDKELHELRIECKRLRYLLEFFSSLLPAKASSGLIGHLKELQENLGDFVDVSVQIGFMLRKLESLGKRENGVRQAAAIGGLIVALYRRQEKARESYRETFARFDDEQTGELFEKILTSLQ